MTFYDSKVIQMKHFSASLRVRQTFSCAFSVDSIQWIWEASPWTLTLNGIQIIINKLHSLDTITSIQMEDFSVRCTSQQWKIVEQNVKVSFFILCFSVNERRKVGQVDFMSELWKLWCILFFIIFCHVWSIRGLLTKVLNSTKISRIMQ